MLGSGQTFTVLRRETNLDTATLDGVLTANIQPEGLQVGDVIDMAVSISSSDPVLKGHVEMLAGDWNGVPVGRAHVRVQWPSDLPLRVRATPTYPLLKPIRAGGVVSIEYSMDGLKPLEAPKGAPARYRLGRAIEFTDFASWADLGALLAPLYQKAGTLPASGPLVQEVDKVRAGSSDPKKRAEAALALVQDRVRYVALAMGTGGLVPADAETTWARRFGDCKAKTALLLAVLHALNIDAEPVAANAISGDGIDGRLPMVGLFNHVLVRAVIAGKVYWLDGTRTGDTSLDRLTVPDFGWGLPVVASGATLTRLMPAPLTDPGMSVTISIDARKGVKIPAPFHVEMILRGDAAIASNQGLTSLAPDTRDNMLRDFWRKSYDNVDVGATTATFDPKTAVQTLTMDGMVKMDWSSGSYETDGTGLGYKADFTRDPGQDRDAPFAVNYPFYSLVTERIQLPPGFAGARGGTSGDVDETIAGIQYHRKVTVENNVFTVTSSERSVEPEFPAKNAPSAQAALRTLSDSVVRVGMPGSYRLTDEELKASMDTTPTTAAGFVSRGNDLLDRGRFGDAIKDFDAAIALDPKNVYALADRGIARVWKGDLEEAGKDLASADAIDPRNAIVFRARGLIADHQNKPRDAIAAYSTALDIEPNNPFALARRAKDYRAVGDSENALKDSAAALKVNPRDVDLYLLRANIFRSMGKKDDAVAEAAAVASANPDSAYAQTVSGAIYAAFLMKPEAIKAYDRAIAIKPEPYTYLTRSGLRAPEDKMGRMADIDAALKIDPKSLDALFAKAALTGEGGDWPSAVAQYTALLADYPDNVRALAGRGTALARKGDMAAAEKDFALARAKATSADELNELCWSKATAGIALDSALLDCDAALAKQPDAAAIIDSRAFVLLRLGRYDDAIAGYDAALAKEPMLVASLFGRGVAWAHKGDKAKAAADFAKAEENDPNVKARFAVYGVSVPN